MILATSFRSRGLLPKASDIGFITYILLLDFRPLYSSLASLSETSIDLLTVCFDSSLTGRPDEKKLVIMEKNPPFYSDFYFSSVSAFSSSFYSVCVSTTFVSSSESRGLTLERIYLKAIWGLWVLEYRAALADEGGASASSSRATGPPLIPLGVTGVATTWP